MKDNDFIPYRCYECKYGEYIFPDATWDSGCGAETDEECEEIFEDDW